jgi:hypothetical protein
MTQCDGVTMLAGGKAAPRRGKRGDDASWADVILTRTKMKKIYAAAGTNGW